MAGTKLADDTITTMKVPRHARDRVRSYVRLMESHNPSGPRVTFAEALHTLLAFADAGREIASEHDARTVRRQLRQALVRARFIPPEQRP